jgi:hypothetical protein
MKKSHILSGAFAFLAAAPMAFAHHGSGARYYGVGPAPFAAGVAPGYVTSPFVGPFHLPFDVPPALGVPPGSMGARANGTPPGVVPPSDYLRGVISKFF